MAKIRFEFDEDGLRALAEEVGAKIQQVDTALRETPLIGHPVEEIKAKAAGALQAIGVELPDESLTEYAQSIADGNDFEFVVG